jgi:hypothetical protein
MSRRQLKKDVLAILHKSSLGEIFQLLAGYQSHRLLNPLFIALCHPVERVRWHAVCSFGWLVPAIAEKDLEAGRIVMRRFLWSLNDESGGIGWGGPEAMAEIMCHSSPLRKEYLHMLISYMREDGEALFQDGNYLELPMLQRGLLWGIGRLCQDHRREMIEQRIVDDVSAYLESSDMHVIGLAIWCLGLLGVENGLEKIRRFQNCNEGLCLFLNYEIKHISVAELARGALSVAPDNKYVVAGCGIPLNTKT